MAAITHDLTLLPHTCVHTFIVTIADASAPPPPPIPPVYTYSPARSHVTRYPPVLPTESVPTISTTYTPYHTGEPYLRRVY
jgi:hypothetical protein